MNGMTFLAGEVTSSVSPADVIQNGLNLISPVITFVMANPYLSIGVIIAIVSFVVYAVKGMLRH